MAAQPSMPAEYLPPTGSRAHPPADWWPRFGAALLDAALLAVVVAVPAIAVFATGLEERTAGTIILVLAYAALWLYPPLMLAFNGGRTVGKAVVGIRVVNRDGAPIGLGRALLREIPVKTLLSLLLVLDPLWALWEPEKRTLHDLVVGTRVVSA